MAPAPVGAAAVRRLLAEHPTARRSVAVATAAHLAGVAALLLALAAVAAVVADVVDHGATLDEVAPLLWTAVALAVVRAVAAAAASGAGDGAAIALVDGVRRRLAARTATLVPAGTCPLPDGELAAVVGDGVEELGPYVSRYLPARAAAAVVPLVVGGVIAVLDPWTTIVLAFAGPMLVVLLALIGARTRAAAARRMAELTWLRGFFLDVLVGLATLKAFARSAEEAATIEEVSRRHGDTSMAVLVTAFQTSLALEWASVAATALVAVEVAFRLVGGDLGFATALTVLVLTPEFFAPLRRLAAEYHAGGTGTAAAEQVLVVLDAPDPAGDGDGPADRDATPAHPATGGTPGLVLRGVTVRYPGRAVPALAEVSLEVAPGEVVALTGPSGAGKTTVARAVLGFVEPSGGTIAIDGEEVGPVARRASVAWVPQRPHLFAGSVADNLRLGRPDADDDVLAAAAEAAGLTGVIDRLPERWATPLGERGARLSGGERQRLAIARALVADRPVVVLDEPTAHLDERLEAEVLAAVRALAARRATLVIAHRPASIALADRVVCLDGGRVLADGAAS